MCQTCDDPACVYIRREATRARPADRPGASNGPFGSCTGCALPAHAEAPAEQRAQHLSVLRMSWRRRSWSMPPCRCVSKLGCQMRLAPVAPC